MTSGTLPVSIMQWLANCDDSNRDRLFGLLQLAEATTALSTKKRRAESWRSPKRNADLRASLEGARRYIPPSIDEIVEKIAAMAKTADESSPTRVLLLRSLRPALVGVTVPLLCDLVLGDSAPLCDEGLETLRRLGAEGRESADAVFRFIIGPDSLERPATSVRCPEKSI